MINILGFLMIAPAGFKITLAVVLLVLPCILYYNMKGDE